jgi:hypothetical protein
LKIADLSAHIIFFEISLQKYLCISKKSSTFAASFKNDVLTIKNGLLHWRQYMASRMGSKNNQLVPT